MKMAQTGLAHTCPGEATPDQRIIDDGVQTSAWGENVGDYSPTPDAWGGVQMIEKTMLAEQAPNDGDRKHLLSTNFTLIGVGVYVDGNGTSWVTEDFVK